MSEKKRDVDIIESVKQLSELTKDADIKVLHVFKVTYNETYGAIIELDSKSFNVLMTKKKIIIGSNLCDVTESLSVLRCYKCCGYNHKSNTCMNKRACLRCGGEHIIKECMATKIESINCKTVAEKLNLNIDCGHRAWSKSCTVLQNNIQRERHRVC